MARNRKHFSGFMEQTIASSAMLERSINTLENSKSRITNVNNLSESMNSSIEPKLRDTRSEVTCEDQAKQLLFDMQNAVDKLLLKASDPLCYQLFVSILRSLGMISHSNS